MSDRFDFLDRLIDVLSVYSFMPNTNTELVAVTVPPVLTEYSDIHRQIAETWIVTFLVLVTIPATIRTRNYHLRFDTQPYHLLLAVSEL